MTSPQLQPKRSVSFSALPPSQQIALDETNHQTDETNHKDPHSIAPLSNAPLGFGFGELLKDGAGEGDADEYGDIVIADKKDEVGKSLRGRYIVRVGWDDVRGWLGEGGTLIGSSRCPSCGFPLFALADFANVLVRERQGRLQAAQNLIKFGIDCLAVCGGDGSLTGADKLRGEWPSLIEELHEAGHFELVSCTELTFREDHRRRARGLQTSQHCRSRRVHRVGLTF